MNKKKNTNDLIPWYMKELKQCFKEYHIKQIDDNAIAISSDGKKWNTITIKATWYVDRETKRGFVPKYNPNTCFTYQRYLEKLEMRERKADKMKRLKEVK